jgi:hypothetical protein
MVIRRASIVAALLLTATVFAEDVSYRKEVFHNDRVTAYLLEIPPLQTSSHRYDKDNVTIFVSGGRAGETQSRRERFLQNVRNDSTSPLRAIVLEFNDSQGEAISEMVPVKKQCADGSKTACVEQKHLFCTAVLCAEDVKIGPHAARSGFASDAAQMLVAVSDYALTDALNGTGPATHSRTSGQVEWLPTGAANRWTNTASTSARFILIRFSPNP